MNIINKHWIPDISGIILGLWIAYMAPIHIDMIASGTLDITIIGHAIAGLLGSIGAIMIIMHKFSGAILNIIAHSVGAIMGLIDIQVYDLIFPPLQLFIPIAFSVIVVSALPLIFARDILK